MFIERRWSVMPNMTESTTPTPSISNATGQPSDDQRFPLYLIIVALLLVVLNLWTVLGNLMVGVALVRFESLRRISNYLIGNLALSDFLLAVTVLPFSMTSDLLGHWVFGETLCKIWLAIDVLYCTASIWNICAIAFDRFTATTFPLWYRERRSGLMAFVYISLVWIWSFVISVPPIILSQSGFNETYSRISDTDTYLCRLYDQQWYVIYSSTGSFILPIGILTILYAKIFAVLHRQSRIRQRKRTTTVSSTSPSNLQTSREIPPRQKQNSSSNSTAHCDQPSTDMDNRVSFRDESSSRSRAYKSESDSTTSSLNDSLFIRRVSGRLSTTSTSGIFHHLFRKQQLHVGVYEHSITSAKPPVQSRVTSENSFATTHDCSKCSQTASRSATSGDGGATRPVTFASCSKRRRQSLKRFTRREAEATKKCLYIIVAFLIAWMPFLVTYLLRGMTNLAVHPYIMTAIIWCGYASSAMNPCLYALYSEEFRRAFRKILVQATGCR